MQAKNWGVIEASLDALISAHPEMGVFNDVIASEARQSPAARANAG